MIVVAPFLFSKRFRALALYPFIFVATAADAQDRVLLQHERIHFRQQKELLFVFFYLFYALDFLRNLFRFRGNAQQAYRCICFEQEAYTFEHDATYLNSRKLFAWRVFL